MKISDFKEKKAQKQDVMSKKLDTQKLQAQKLENVQSLWYVVTSSQKKKIMGSKG